jgi:ketosteroid isomerase-like protein
LAVLLIKHSSFLMDQSFPEPAKKAFDFASEATKQLLTLSTGIIAVTITFSKDILISVPFSAKVFLMTAWGAYVLSLVFGLFTLLALTGELQEKPAEDSERNNEDTTDTATNAAAAALLVTGTDAEITFPARVPSIYAPSIRVASALQIVSFLFGTAFVVTSGVLSTLNTRRAQVAPGPEAAEAVKNFQRDLFDALTRRDSAFLTRNYSDDYLLTDQFGQVLNKAQAISGMQSGELTYEQITTSDSNIRVFGDTAIENGGVAIKGKHKGQEINGDYRFMLALVNRERRWQVLAMQLSLVTARGDQPVQKTALRNRHRRRASRRRSRDTGRRNPRRRE